MPEGDICDETAEEAAIVLLVKIGLLDGEMPESVVEADVNNVNDREKEVVLAGGTELDPLATLVWGLLALLCACGEEAATVETRVLLPATDPDSAASTDVDVPVQLFKTLKLWPSDFVAFVGKGGAVGTDSPGTPDAESSWFSCDAVARAGAAT